MRITNNTMTYNFLNSLTKNLEKESKIQEQLADGKIIHRPSDDPIKAVRSLRNNTSLSVNTQYTQNAKDAQSWMQTTDGAMSDLSSIMTSIKEKVVQASNGTNDQQAVQAIGTDIDGLINQIVNIGNTKIGDRYIFAGQKDKTTPFVRSGDVVTYDGDLNKISMPLQPGMVSPNQDSVNLTGKDVFGSGGTEILNNLLEIKQHLMSGTSADQQWLSSTGLANLDTDHASILQAQTALGSRMSMYEMAGNMLEGNNTIITQDLASNEDLDIPKAVTDLKTSETVYQTALQAAAKIMQVSLADFL
ncbi:flagellar hook-associated protein FlgL [Pelosinus sp. sgz500959]|uniref:flagellar hook-associated protein FlgL n=1 Tax=Pelosinus sp. sgz500959 TaxID=3242472 RepID=UPI00366FE6A2